MEHSHGNRIHPHIYILFTANLNTGKISFYTYVAMEVIGTLDVSDLKWCPKTFNNIGYKEGMSYIRLITGKMPPKQDVTHSEIQKI